MPQLPYRICAFYETCYSSVAARKYKPQTRDPIFADALATQISTPPRNLAQDIAKLAKQSRTTLLAPASLHRGRGSLPLALPQRRDYVAVVLADIAKLANPSPTCIPIGASPAAAYFHPLRGPCDFKPPLAKRYPYHLSALWPFLREAIPTPFV